MCHVQDSADRDKPCGTTVIAVGAPTWRGLILAAVADYPVLRRQLGCDRAERLMAMIVARLAALLPDADVAAGGREQVEVRFAANSAAALDDSVATVEAAFETPLEIDGDRCAVELALGGVVVEMERFDEVRLIEAAEQALAEARHERRPIVRQVPESVGTVDRIALAQDLRRAIAAEEMFLQYQPKLHMRRQRIASVEALIRWRHPSRGLVLPGDFIPLAEESRDIVALTLWTIRQVIADQRLLRARGHDLCMFINIAGVLLGDARFVRDVAALIEGSGAAIGFEITETSVIRDPTSAIANLKTFADMGITIAIDDYGAGLSSLAYLKQLPARELKIDKLFVTHLTSSHRDPLIVRSTIDLAHAMEMEVVAEGVETQAALALLSVMGCDMVQGFLISRPIGLDALIPYLDEEQHLVSPSDPRHLLGRFGSPWRVA